MYTPKQLKMQEAILLAVHKGFDIEDAKLRELTIQGCVVTVKGVFDDNPGMQYDIVTHYAPASDMISLGYYGNIPVAAIETIIGLPATLERTLVALGDRYIYKECSLVAMIVYDEPIEGEKCYFVEIPRKLLNENGTPCDLFQQDESTQKEIALLLGYKDE